MPTIMVAVMMPTVVRAGMRKDGSGQGEARDEREDEFLVHVTPSFLFLRFQLQIAPTIPPMIAAPSIVHPHSS